jgi:hypothetical protein
VRKKMNGTVLKRAIYVKYATKRIKSRLYISVAEGMCSTGGILLAIYKLREKKD